MRSHMPFCTVTPCYVPCTLPLAAVHRVQAAYCSLLACVVRRFTLVYVLYSTAIATPGHGSLSPLALGFTYYVIVATGPLWHQLSHPKISGGQRCSSYQLFVCTQGGYGAAL